MRPIITLTTDFGTGDAYVAAMKGVILSINPEAVLVDICHAVQPQNILEAAYVLSTVCPFFPERTIHVVVVDPGVGTERRAVILRTPAADFVAPDNGVLSYVLAAGGVRSVADALPAGWEGVELTRPGFWRSPLSATFHGRDKFAPVAARLSLGLTPQEFGGIITSFTVLPLPRPRREADGSLVGHIIHIDSFGNLITDIEKDDIPAGAVAVEVGGRRIRGLSHTYAEGGELLALVGSSDRLEIAVEGGSARSLLQAKVGDEVRVVRAL